MGSGPNGRGPCEEKEGVKEGNEVSYLNGRCTGDVKWWDLTSMAGEYWVKEGNEGVLPQWERHIGSVRMGSSGSLSYEESTG